MNINRDNYYNNTYAVFKGCKRPRRKPDYVSRNMDGEISSEYWYGSKGDYVIRCSKHWSSPNNCFLSKPLFRCGRIASCYWELRTSHSNRGCGKAYFRSFKGRG